MWEQRQNMRFRCGNSGRISEQELEVVVVVVELMLNVLRCHLTY